MASGGFSWHAKSATLMQDIGADTHKYVVKWEANRSKSVVKADKEQAAY